MRRRGVALAAATVLTAGCSWLGRLPYDPNEVPPAPDGGRIRASVGWLTTAPDNAVPRAPDGSVEISIVHLRGHTWLQRVRHVRSGDKIFGDSILLDRSTLRPFETYRWTAKGTFIVRYDHRVIDRTFIAPGGQPTHSTETLEVEPYSALGFDLIVAALPLFEGYHSMLPVVVDTVQRGWSWMHFTVQREMTLQERPDQPERDTYVVDCDLDKSRTRYWVAADGHTVRKIEELDQNNVVLSTLRRMLLTFPQPSHPAH